MTTSLSAAFNASRIDAILNEQNINGFEFPGGTDKQTLHSYGPVYEALLQPFADGRRGKILEIGVQHGGSILLWNDLCPNASIIGIDTKDVAHPSIRERVDSDRVSFVTGDAYGDDMLPLIANGLFDDLDVIIDDGPHTLESQCAFLHRYLPFLAQDGVAVIEDVQFGGWFRVLRSCVPDGFVSEAVDRTHVKGRYDDLMFIVRRAE